jgi:hypothetical protein
MRSQPERSGAAESLGGAEAAPKSSLIPKESADDLQPIFGLGPHPARARCTVGDTGRRERTRSRAPSSALNATSGLSQVFGADKVATYDHTRELDTIDLDQLRAQGYRAAVLCAWQLPKLRGRFNLFVNSVSFQEMEPRVVQNYASLVQGLVDDYLLLRNSIAGKVVAREVGEIGVVEPIVRDDYPRFFDQFERVAADGEVFGDTSSKGFVSEVTVWQRR